VLVRLRELDRLKDEFVTVVSHELRTPLASVYGAATTMRRRELDDETRDALLSIIYSQSDRLARLLDEVLWASRVEADRGEAQTAPCDAAAVAREAVDAAEALVSVSPSVDHSVELRADPSLPPVAADAEKLRQVLTNLIENAVKYSPDGGRVEVTLRRVGRHLRASVRDEGLGIPQNEQELIFQRFHRVDPHLTRGVSGTGLGLYICRELVGQMNGRIWVSSREGEGSEFSFELPLAA
jgi:signal transduction histidine kinase